MAIYKCSICGYEYDEEKEGIPFEDLPADWKCPICTAPSSVFEKQGSSKEQHVEKKKEVLKEAKAVNENTPSLEYLKEFKKIKSEYEPQMDIIHQIAVSGKSIIEPMGTTLPVISWDDILVMGAQLFKIPLGEHDPVDTTTIIGKKAKKPMILESPIYISHMSFGALSKETKIAMAKGAAMAKTAMCSGEGGILEEEYDSAYRYIFEYVPNLYSVNDENLKKVDAIEIKIGQGTKPGMGGHLPAGKVTEEIARVRGKEIGKDIISPSHFENVTNKEELKALVDQLRERSEGRPIGIKIAAGNIEQDMEVIAYADPDFITVDGRGGATGASPKFLKDATSVPTIFALYRAKKYIKEHHLNIDLVITGGLRVSGDFAKALAMGADAVAVASAAMMATACMQYRVCHNGNCPMGIATQDDDLRKRLQVEQAAKRVYHYLHISNEELKSFAKITGNKNIHELSVSDLATTNSEISDFTDIRHV